MKVSQAPMRVSRKWLHWAHGPGAEDGQELALKLIGLAASQGRNLAIEINDPVLVAEIVDVAELYQTTRPGDALHDMGPWWRAQPARLIRAGRAWLRRQAPATATKGTQVRQPTNDSSGLVGKANP